MTAMRAPPGMDLDRNLGGSLLAGWSTHIEAALEVLARRRDRSASGDAHVTALDCGEIPALHPPDILPGNAALLMSSFANCTTRHDTTQQRR